MKEPTTPYAIDVQKHVQITRHFLQLMGWRLDEEYPLFEVYTHSKDDLLKCSIGLYGEFSIWTLHWCNKTPEKTFNTINPRLTLDDYYKIIELLNIKVPG